MRALALAILLNLVFVAATPGAGGYIFRWVDAKGALHVTDRLGDVPEPYYSMYAAEIKRREEQRGKAKPPVSQPPPRATAPQNTSSESSSRPSIVDQELARRKHWRGLVAEWRGKLDSATQALERVDQELAQARLNPLLATTPPVRAKIADLEKKRGRALAEVEAARKMLLETLPKRARKEHVPPKWLM